MALGAGADTGAKDTLQLVQQVTVPLASLQVHQVVTSTNDVVVEDVERTRKLPCAVVAFEQQAGRGRQKKAWASPKGGIYLSVAVRPHHKFADKPGLLPLVCGLAVHDALEQVCGIEALLKWPNDVMVTGADAGAASYQKLAGILLEAHTLQAENRTPYVVCGIGINVHQPELEEGVQAGYRVASLTSCGITEDKLDTVIYPLVAQVISGVVRLLDASCATDEPAVTELLTQYKKFLIWKNQQVVVKNSSGVETLRGVLQDVAPSGQLEIVSAEGTSTLVSAGNVSLRPAQ